MKPWSVQRSVSTYFFQSKSMRIYLLLLIICVFAHIVVCSSKQDPEEDPEESTEESTEEATEEESNDSSDGDASEDNSEEEGPRMSTACGAVAKDKVPSERACSDGKFVTHITAKSGGRLDSITIGCSDGSGLQVDMLPLLGGGGGDSSMTFVHLQGFTVDDLKVRASDFGYYFGMKRYEAGVGNVGKGLECSFGKMSGRLIGVKAVTGKVIDNIAFIFDGVKTEEQAKKASKDADGFDLEDDESDSKKKSTKYDKSDDDGDSETSSSGDGPYDSQDSKGESKASKTGDSPYDSGDGEDSDGKPGSSTKSSDKNNSTSSQGDASGSPQAPPSVQQPYATASPSSRGGQYQQTDPQYAQMGQSYFGGQSGQSGGGQYQQTDPQYAQMVQSSFGGQSGQSGGGQYQQADPQYAQIGQSSFGGQSGQSGGGQYQQTGLSQTQQYAQTNQQTLQDPQTQPFAQMGQSSDGRSGSYQAQQYAQTYQPTAQQDQTDQQQYAQQDPSMQQ
jgi:hypothetical protein